MEIKVSKLNAVQAGFIKQTHYLYLNIEFTSEEMARDLLYKLWEFYGDDWMKESLSREQWLISSIDGGAASRSEASCLNL
jgi:hypothetical protein